MRPVPLVALLVLAVPAVALAGSNMQGSNMQGSNMQGSNMQGSNMQGSNMQGTSLNGVSLAGVTGGVSLALDKTTFKGSIVMAQPYSCPHRPDVGGSPMGACNKCAQIVDQYDPYCGAYWWDGICVAEANDWCTFEGAELVGTEFTTQVENQSPIQVRMTRAEVASDPTPHFVLVNGQWVNDSPNENADMLQYEFSAVTPRQVQCGNITECEDPYGCWTYYTCWESQPETLTPVCGESGIDHSVNKAIPVPGQWNNCKDDPRCGGKTPGTEQTQFALACHDTGALAKCVERFQYKPWLDPFDPVAAPSLEACQYALRADYCGDGNSHTYNNNWIDVEDLMVVQRLDREEERRISTERGEGPRTWGDDAVWGLDGAHCVVTARFDQFDPIDGTFENYVNKRWWCKDKFIPLGGEYKDRWRCAAVVWHTDPHLRVPGEPKLDADPRKCIVPGGSVEYGTWCHGLVNYPDGSEQNADWKFWGYLKNTSISLY